MKTITITYLIIASVIWLLGYLHNGKYVRPKWKIPGKFIFYVSISTVFAHWLDHWALLFIVLHPLIGLIFHIQVCQKHNINWRNCEPKEKYLELQEKWAKGDFS